MKTESEFSNSEIMSKIMQNLLVLLDPPLQNVHHDISLKAGMMCLNRFCIDEDAAYELSVTNRHNKFKNDIDSIFSKNSENEDVKTHLIYAGGYYFQNEHVLRSLILEGMKKYKLEQMMVTMIYMEKWKLIAKEKVEKYCKGESERKKSVNDDLELFFEDLELGKEPDEEVLTYFLPKLTEETMELVERKDPYYFATFAMAENLNHLRITDLKLSDSDSKYVDGWCTRKTFTLKNSVKSSNRHCSLQ